MEYNEGDRVKVKEYNQLLSVSKGGVDEERDLFINGVYFVEEMKIFCGEEATINNKLITKGGLAYKLSFDNPRRTRDWSFNNEMLQRSVTEMKIDKNEFNEELLWNIK